MKTLAGLEACFVSNHMNLHRIDVVLVSLHGTRTEDEFAEHDAKIDACVIGNDGGYSQTIDPGNEEFKVHAGFAREVIKCYPGLKKAIEKVLKKHPECQEIVFTGHSMGAALAQLAALFYRKMNPNPQTQSIKVFVFSSPSIFSSRAQQVYNATLGVLNSIHIFVVGDIVTTPLSPLQLGHAGTSVGLSPLDRRDFITSAFDLVRAIGDLRKGVNFQNLTKIGKDSKNLFVSAHTIDEFTPSEILVAMNIVQANLRAAKSTSRNNKILHNRVLDPELVQEEVAVDPTETLGAEFVEEQGLDALDIVELEREDRVPDPENVQEVEGQELQISAPQFIIRRVEKAAPVQNTQGQTPRTNAAMPVQNNQNRPRTHTQSSRNPRAEIAAQQMYSGQGEGDIHTCMFLGIGDSHDKKEGCCSCDSCRSYFGGGVFIGIITYRGALPDINEAETRNILWSGHSSFRPSSEHERCCRNGLFFPKKADYKFQYVTGENYIIRGEDGEFIQGEDGLFNAIAYGEETDKFLYDEDDCLSLQELPEFLKLNGEGIHQKVDFFCSPVRTGEYPLLRIVQTYKDSLYRWEIQPSTITDVLKTIGNLGKDTNREVPRYHKVGCNCARFAKEILEAYDIPCSFTPNRTWKFWLGHGVVHTASAVGGFCVAGPVGGFAAASATGSADWFFQTKKGQTLPNELVEQILECHKQYQEKRKHNPNAPRNDVKESFCIIAHIPADPPQTRPGKRHNMLNYHSGINFVHRTALEATNKNIKKPKGSCFLNKQFK